MTAVAEGSLSSALAAAGLGEYRLDLDGEDALAPPLTVIARSPARERQALIKEKRAYLSAAEFEAHIALQRFVHEKGGPVVPLLGDNPIRWLDGRQLEAQRWVEGRPPSLDSRDDLATAAATLATFHDASRGFAFPQRANLHQEPRERFAKARFYRSFLVRGLRSEDHPLVGRLDRALAAAADEQRRQREAWGPEEALPVHGDPAPSNFVLGPGLGPRGCLLIDLDDCHLGTRLEDLAWMLTLTAGLEWLGGDGWRVRPAWDTQTAAAVFRGYGPLVNDNPADGPDGDAAEEQPAEQTAERLRPWLVASLVVAAVDCFAESGTPVEARALLEAEIPNLLILIDTVGELDDARNG